MSSGGRPTPNGSAGHMNDSEPCGPAVFVNGIRQNCDCGVFDNALDYAGSELWDNDPGECFAKGADWGAGWMAAIITMALAIQDNHPPIIERSYWTSEISGIRGYSCRCPGCGVWLKGRVPGLHEGTDEEWCGVCRY
jgi:hypothetical protein